MITRRFAWWPIRVTSGQRIWLSIYYQHKLLYDPSTGRPPINNLHFTWTETAMERTWRILKDEI